MILDYMIRLLALDVIVDVSQIPHCVTMIYVY